MLVSQARVAYTILLLQHKEEGIDTEIDNKRTDKQTETGVGSSVGRSEASQVQVASVKHPK